MLAAANRLGDASVFREVTRQGSRAASRSLVVHLRLCDGESRVEPQIGLVVSRAVGNAVARTRVKRRLRHQLRPWVARLPAGAQLVVRALPAAAGASSATLADDLERGLSKALTKAGPTSAPQVSGVSR